MNRPQQAQIVAALKEAAPDLFGGDVEAMKKDALLTASASRLAGRRWVRVGFWPFSAIHPAKA